MKLPTRVSEIVNALYLRNVALSEGTDDQRRQLALMIAQQARFELGRSWGHKRASNGRPPAKDAIAQIQPDGRLFVWDLFSGTTGKPFASPNSMDGSNQVFILVEPIDHLGVSVPQQPPTPPVPVFDPRESLIILSDHIDELIHRVEALEARLANPIRTTATGTAFLSHSHEVKF